LLVVTQEFSTSDGILTEHDLEGGGANLHLERTWRLGTRTPDLR
jgi:hypothetical protein